MSGHLKQEQETACVLIQRILRGYNGRKKAERKKEQINIRLEEQRFNEMMLYRKMWLNSIKIQKVCRGHLDRCGEKLREAKHRMKSIILVQSHWRIKKSAFLFLILTAKRKIENIAARKIQRVALGYAGRKRAKLRKKVKVMEERETLLGDRSYVIAQGFRREGACVLLQRWIRHMHGGWMNPKFVGHELMIRPQSLWRGHRDRTSNLLLHLQNQRWMENMLKDNLEVTIPAATKLSTWWRGRHRRKLFQLMLKATADHIEELRMVSGLFL